MARDPYEVVLADLRAKRDEIENLIRSLEAFRPVQGSPPPTSSLAALYGQSAPKQPSAVGPLYGLSIVDASKAVLRERGGPMPVSEIVAALKEGGHVMNSEDPANTVSSVLNRAMQQSNGVLRIGRGIWTLAPKTVEEQIIQGMLASDMMPEPDADNAGGEDPEDPFKP